MSRVWWWCQVDARLGWFGCVMQMREENSKVQFLVQINLGITWWREECAYPIKCYKKMEEKPPRGRPTTN